MTVKEGLEMIRHTKPKFGDDGFMEAVKLAELYCELERRRQRYRPGEAPPEKFIEHIMAADVNRMEVLLGIGYAAPARRGVKNTWQGVFDAAREAECSSPKSASGATASA